MEYITVASGAVYLQHDSALENTRVLTSRKHTRRERRRGEKKGYTLKIKVLPEDIWLCDALNLGDYPK